MEQNIIDIMKNNGVKAGDSMDLIISLLTLSDEEFAKVYDLLKDRLSKAFSSVFYQLDMLRQLETTDSLEIDEEIKAVQKALESLNEEETLSEQKKELISTMLNESVSVVSSLSESGRVGVKVKICKLSDDAILPSYAHVTDAGMDICSNEEVLLEPGTTKIVHTGIAVAIPNGYEIQVRPRSGLSLKTPLRIANAPGTIDSEYRGEIGIIVTNTGTGNYVIDKGVKIAQLVLAPTPKILWEEVESVENLGTTERGKGGYGSTDEVVNV